MNSLARIFLLTLPSVVISCSGKDDPEPKEQLIPELLASVQSLSFKTGIESANRTHLFTNN